MPAELTPLEEACGLLHVVVQADMIPDRLDAEHVRDAYLIIQKLMREEHRVRLGGEKTADQQTIDSLRQALASHADHIVTSYDCPPIPDRNHDWSARRDGYDAGDPLGYGATEGEAVADLLEQEAERDEQAEQDRQDSGQFGVGA